VSHGHVLVNGRTVNIASYNVKAGDEITIKDKPKSRQLVLRNLDLTQIVPVPDWLTVDRDALSGKVSHIPSREEMQPIVNEQLMSSCIRGKASTRCIPFIRNVPWIKVEIDETNFRRIILKASLHARMVTRRLSTSGL